MIGETSGVLSRCEDDLSQKEATLQERMDSMLNQRQISLEQETKGKWLDYYETIHAEFRTKTDVALERYKQHSDALERQVWDLEVGLKEAAESHRGVEQALEEASAERDYALSNLEQVEQENQAMVH
jgi:hypothetical protein